jgi:hypothetical protein
MEGSSMDSALVDVAFASAASGMDEDEPRPSPIKPKKLTESTNTPATTPSQSSKATRLVPKSILEQRRKNHLSVQTITHQKELNHLGNLA